MAENLFPVLFPCDGRICPEPVVNCSRLPVCPNCLERIHPIRGNVCSICGERVLSSDAEAEDDGLPRCPVYRRVRPAAAGLGRRLAGAIAFLQPSFTQKTVLLVPVPLDRGRRHRRRFNQAELISRLALKVLNVSLLELRTNILVRKRETHSQIGLTSLQRRENLRSAFALTRAQQVIGRQIVLVDDVYTTGTTMTECAKVLRRAGAAEVWVAMVARTRHLSTLRSRRRKQLETAVATGVGGLAGVSSFGFSVSSSTANAVLET